MEDSLFSLQIVDHKLFFGEDDKSQWFLRVHGKRSGRKTDEVNDGGAGGEKGDRFPVTDRDSLGTTVGFFRVSSAADDPWVTGGVGEEGEREVEKEKQKREEQYSEKGEE